MPQILPAIGGDWEVVDPLRLRLGFLGHIKRDAKFVDCNQAEAFWRERIAEHNSHARAGLPCPS
jgi:hypothetical protein